ncbi:hypothetical protein [Pseudopelagicola sp. nBUS_19]|uniref:hypothetical protein n=1 Tax=Pseudopelagicola sp. nBUS_19 TaxID=3395316 RepID=UPI003EBA43EB
MTNIAGGASNFSTPARDPMSKAKKRHSSGAHVLVQLSQIMSTKIFECKYFLYAEIFLTCSFNIIYLGAFGVFTHQTCGARRLDLSTKIAKVGQPF